MRVFGILLSLLFLFGCDNNGSGGTREQEIVKEDKINNLTLSAINGSSFVVNQFKTDDKNLFKNLNIKGNKAIVLFFLTTWCEPCINIIPHLQRLQDQFGDIVIYGIPIDDYISDIENFSDSINVFTKENDIAIPFVIDDNRFRLLKYLKDMEGIPLVVIYDKNGDYVMDYLGAVPEEMVEFDISEMLKNN